MRQFAGICAVSLLSTTLLSLSALSAERTLTRESFTFGTLTPPSDTQVRVQAAKWLQESGQFEGAVRQQFDQLWAREDAPLLDRLAQTFALADPQVNQLLQQARTHDLAAPTSLPALLQDTSKSTFFRANLALAYAKALSNRKVYEEALETLKLFKPEQVVDPASFLFHKAVAEHGLMLKKEANDTIARLLDDVPTAPERYKMVAALMHFDMIGWQDKDLASIARKMDNIQRRLDLSRGGKKTQKLQKEVVARLDELIKELENKQQGGG